MKKLVILWLCLVVPLSVHANYLEKTNLEKGIKDKAQHMLDTMYGPYLFSVSVSVNMGKESWDVSYTERADINFKEKKDLPSEKYKILPGYSAIKNLSPNEAVQMPFNSKITKLSAPIISIHLDIVTSKTVVKRDVKNANKILTKLLNLDMERGDTINFTFENFPIHREPQDEIKVDLPIEAKLMMLMLALTSVFLMVYILLNIKQLNVNREAVKAQQAAAKAAAAARSAPSKEKEKDMDDSGSVSGVAPVGSDDQHGFFQFVGHHNADQFIGIVQRSELSVESLAMVLSFIHPMIAKDIMDTLDEAKQLELVTQMSNEVVADKATLDDLESKIRNQLECSVGGASKLGAVIATFKEQKKKAFLTSLQSNLEVYNKIRPDILLFDDIEKLEDSEVKKLIGALNIEVLAAAVAKEDTGSTKKLKSNLTGAATAMVKQFIDLKKDALTEEDVALAQQDIVHTLKELSDSKKINIVSKIVG
jgi:flagellar motor switch protein FliG